VTSFVWAGAGYLTLGDTRTFAGYAALDAIFVGAGVVFALQHQWGALAPVVALDVLLRGWSGGASAREAARRRALRPSWQTSPAVDGVTYYAPRRASFALPTIPRKSVLYQSYGLISPSPIYRQHHHPTTAN